MGCSPLPTCAARAPATYRSREDWVWNVILPTLVYACLFCMGLLVWHRPEQTLFGVAALSLILLFIGIHNAWDIAIWMTLQKKSDGDQ